MDNDDEDSARTLASLTTCQEKQQVIHSGIQVATTMMMTVTKMMSEYNDVDNEDALENDGEQKAVFVHPTCHFEHVSCSASTFDGLP